jgi:hypothetical protein
MKKMLGFVLSAFGLFAVQPAPAQGTLYLSNLGEPSVGSAVIGSDAWIAQLFYTGTNSAGYILDSIQLLMGSASGSPSAFSAMIYSSSTPHPPLNTFSSAPDNSLGSLSGLDPSAGGVFTYTASGLMLSPSTYYFIVHTAATPVAQGSYDWRSTANISILNPSDPWELKYIYYSSTDGSSWAAHLREGVFQLAIYATAVPEPSSIALLSLGGLFFVGSVRNRLRARRIG